MIGLGVGSTTRCSSSPATASGRTRGTAPRRHRHRHGHRRSGRGLRRHHRHDLDARPAPGRPRLDRRHGHRRVGHGARHHAHVDDAAAGPARVRPASASSSPAGGASSPPGSPPIALLGAGIGSGPLAARRRCVSPCSPCVGQHRRARRCAARSRAGRRARSSRRLAHRWSRTIQRDPWAWLGGAAVVLAVLAAPVLGMRLALGRRGQLPRGHADARQAYDLLAEGFGDGFNGPFLITVDAGSRRRRPPTSMRCRPRWRPPPASPP